MKRTLPLASAAASTLALLTGSAERANAQNATPPPAVVAPYRAPVIALVQPASGASVPSDRPVVVFRFAAGEPGDPIDARSFAVTVGGEDRTTLFRMSTTEAWGPLGDDGAIEPGAHQVVARICSARGACSATTALVTVGEPVVRIGSEGGEKGSRKKKKLIDALLGAVRTLIAP